MGNAPHEISLVDLAKDYIKSSYNKPGNVYLGVVSRLDMMATGAIVLARTSKAASRLSQQFRDRTVSKVYWALVAGRLEPAEGVLDDYVRKDESQHRMVTCSAKSSGAKQAKLSYKTLYSGPTCQRLEIQLETGRKHQIRVQLASRQCPILGDRKYRSSKEFPQGIALHSRILTIQHPTTKDELTFTADIPTHWKQYLKQSPA